MKGVVYTSTGSNYLVKEVDSNVFWNCRLRGKLKIDKEIKSSNPIAVGDIVNYDIENEDTKEGIIHNIAPRNNYIVRVSPHNRHHKHIVAANLDQTLLIATVKDPTTSLGFIDRFLITAEMYHIPAILVFNKIDILDANDMLVLQHYQSIYEAIGYQVRTIAAIASNSPELEDLKSILYDKTTLVSGHSGVGKSTLLNQLDTTFAAMHTLENNARIIDTPGVKEFGLVAVTKAELAQYFPEMRKYMSGCKFNNCQHINEPQCAVKNAIEAGEISIERYESYLSIYLTINDNTYS